MHARTPRARHLVVTCIIVFGLLLTACSFVKQAGQSAIQTKVAEVVPTGLPEALETQAAEIVDPGTEEEETPEPEATTEPSGEEESTSLDNTLSKLVDAAPVTISSYYEVKKDDEITASMAMEGEIDSAGNQHVFLNSEDGFVAELYVIDTTMYMRAEEDESAAFLAMEGTAEPGDLSFIAIYGGAFLLSFDDLGEAKRVGSESVNGFETVKYEIQYDLSSLGLSGTLGEVQGMEWNYQGFAWIDQATGAIVKAQVDWSSKEADSDVVESFHSEFDAVKTDFGDLQPPENIINWED